MEGWDVYPDQIPEDDSDENFNIPVPDNIYNEISSLQDSCLNIITRNLKRFVAAFNTSKDETLQRNIHFLRRRYSAEIIQTFQRVGPVEMNFSPKEEDQDSWRFLLNEYLQEFRFDDTACSPIDPDVFLERIAEMGHALRTVDFDTCVFYDTSFINSCTPHLSNVNVLYIPYYCTNETLRIISTSCPKLRVLYCRIHHITRCETFCDGGVKTLCAVGNGVHIPNTTLKKLSLYSDYGWGNPIPECDVKFILENFQSLENLNHPALPKVMYEMHKLDPSKGTKYNITNINLLLQNTKLSSSVYEFLLVCKDVCPHLKKLSTWIDNERELDLIVLFPELKSLRIEQKTSEIDLNSFLKAKGMVFKELILRGFSISVHALMQNCPELEFLYLNEVKFQDNTDCMKAYQLPKLRKFHVRVIGNTGIIRPIKTILNACTNVEELVIDGFMLKGLEALIFFTKFCATRIFLESIIFRYCWIRPILLRSILVNCSRLKTLILNRLVNKCDIPYDYNLFKFVPHKKQYVEVLYDDLDDTEEDIVFEFYNDEYEFE